MTIAPIAFIGLGNPGPQYDVTRHNIGYLAIDQLMDAWGVSTMKTQKGLVKHERIDRNGTAVILAKPLTYMNQSGQGVAWVTQYYKIPPENCWIIYDDVDLPLGTLRIRKSGSAGTHNGMRSIVAHIGSSFPRIRLGIQPGHPVSDLSSYVLGRWTKGDLSIVEPVLTGIHAIVDTILSDGIDAAMNRYN
jgi:PTH1 family peptidyl-tRNA hydrolase